MKKLLFTASIMIVVTTNIIADTSGHYFSITNTLQNDQKSNLFGDVQPVSEISGKGSNQIKVAYGLQSDSIGVNQNIGTKLGLAYMSVPKNKEHAISGEFEVDFLTNNPTGLIPYFGGEVGFGVQLKNGDSFTTSTSTNKASYASGQPYSYTPSTGIFQENPVFLLYGFQLGTKYRFNKSFDIFVAYDYQIKQFQVDYTLVSSPSVHNNMTYGQRFNGLQFGLNYNY